MVRTSFLWRPSTPAALPLVLLFVSLAMACGDDVADDRFGPGQSADFRPPAGGGGEGSPVTEGGGPGSMSPGSEGAVDTGPPMGGSGGMGTSASAGVGSTPSPGGGQSAVSEGGSGSGSGEPGSGSGSGEPGSGSGPPSVGGGSEPTPAGGSVRPPGCDARTYGRLLMPAVNEVSGLWTAYLQSFFEAEGMTVTRGTVNFARLEAADVVVSDANSLFVDDDLDRALQWVSEGGFLVLHGGVVSGSDCRRLHALLSRTGIRFQPVFVDGEVSDCVSPRDSGPLAAFPSPRHPILRDLPDRNFPHDSGNRLVVSAPASAVVTSESGNVLVAAQDLGCGRLLVISSYAIVQPTGGTLDTHWRNILDWGTWQ